MEIYKLENMTGGWFIGDFTPVVIPSKDVEVAIKNYKQGDCESKHHHRIATELTVIAVGKARMNEFILNAGDVMVIKPGESTDFEALEDCSTTVVKFPSVAGDKYVD